MNSIIVNIQIVINVIIYFVGYVSPFDFSQESYMVVVFDGIDIKVRVFSTAKEALDAKRVFIKAGWSVEVTIINNIFDNKQPLLVYVLPCVCTPLPLHGMQYKCSSMHVCTTIVIIHEQGDYHEMGYSNGHSLGNNHCMCSG